MKKMKIAILPAILLFAFASVLSATASLIASDYAANYTSWTNGSTAGTNFGAWTISSYADPGAYAGTILGNPETAGIGGLGTNAFGLYANPTGSNAWVTVERNFSNALNNGDIFSIVWGVNFDSGSSGNKGLSLMSSTGEVFNINLAGSPAITLNGTAMFNNYGTNAMTISFQNISDTSVRIFANGRDGVESFDQTFTINSSSMTGFKLYASSMQGGDAAQPYFDSMMVNSIPEPVSGVLIGCGIGVIYAIRRLFRK